MCVDSIMYLGLRLEGAGGRSKVLGLPVPTEFVNDATVGVDYGGFPPWFSLTYSL